MKSFSTLYESVLNESGDVSDNFDVTNFIEWFSTLSIPRIAPKTVKPFIHQIMKELVNLVNEYKIEKDKRFGDISIIEFTIKGKLNNLRMTKEEIEQLYSVESGEQTYGKVLVKKHATFVKMDSVSYKTFVANCENIDDFLGTLQGFHRAPLQNLTIRFVDGSAQKSIAKYVSGQDILQINSKKAGNTKEEYGSLRYIVLHELGHRYLNFHKQHWDHDAVEWTTTKYSETDTLTGEEKFAELFALSHWPNKYPQFKDTIQKFTKMIS